MTSAVAAPLQVVIGDWAARTVASEQPVKLAAIEGLGPTTTGAPEHLLGWYDGHKVVYGIGIPRLLALLAFHNPNATVQGLDTVPPAMLASGWWVLFLVTLPLGVSGSTRWLPSQLPGLRRGTVVERQTLGDQPDAHLPSRFGFRVTYRAATTTRWPQTCHMQLRDRAGGLDIAVNSPLAPDPAAATRALGDPPFPTRRVG